MSQLSFYKFAERGPGVLALVDPDRREWSRRELLAASNRICHGLRALGVEKGDCVAAVLPNSAEMIQLYLALFQSGMYLTPINYHLTVPEIAYIIRDSDAKVFVGAERFAEACVAATNGLGFEPERLFSLGPVPGYRSFDELGAGQPESLPEERSTGQIMNYTSGTTGQP